MRVCVLYNTISFRTLATYFLGLPSIIYSRQKQVSNSVKIGRLFHRFNPLVTNVIYIYIYIYGAPILDVSRSHTTTQHSR